MGKSVSRLCGSGRQDGDYRSVLSGRCRPEDLRRSSLPYGVTDDDAGIWVPLITIDRNANTKLFKLDDEQKEFFVMTSDELKGGMKKHSECRACRMSEISTNKSLVKSADDVLCRSCKQQQVNQIKQSKDEAKLNTCSEDENANTGPLERNQIDASETQTTNDNKSGNVDNLTNDSVQFRNCPSQSKLTLLTERLHRKSSEASLSTNDSFDTSDLDDVPNIRSPVPNRGRLPRRKSDGDLQSFHKVRKGTMSSTESQSLSGTPKLFKRRQSDGHLSPLLSLKEKNETSLSSKLSAIAERFGSGKQKIEVNRSLSYDFKSKDEEDKFQMSARNDAISKYVCAEGLSPPPSPGKTPKPSIRRKLSTIRENFGRRKSRDATPEEETDIPGNDTKQFQLSNRFNRRRSENDLHIPPMNTPLFTRKDDGSKSPPQVKSPSIMRRFSRRQSEENVPSFHNGKQTRSPSIINTISGRLGRRKSDGHVQISDFIKSSKMTVDTKLARRLSQKACEHKISPTHANKAFLVNWGEAQLFKKEPLLIKSDGDTKRCWITGLAVISEDYVLVTDHLNKAIKTVYVWDSMVTFSLPLESEPWAIALVSVDIVAVSLPFAKAIQFVSVREGSLALLPKIKTCGNCYGVASLGDKLCISTFNPATVQILSFTGIVLRTVAADASGFPLFVWPENLAATSDAIYVTDVNTDTVTKLTYQGDVIGQYKDNSLVLPTGISAIDDHHLFVTSFGNGSMHVLSTDLKQVTVFDLRGQMDSMDSVGFCTESRMIYVRSNAFGTSEIEDYLTVFGLD